MMSFVLGGAVVAYLELDVMECWFDLDEARITIVRWWAGHDDLERLQLQEQMATYVTDEACSRPSDGWGSTSASRSSTATPT